MYRGFNKAFNMDSAPTGYDLLITKLIFVE